MRAFSIMTKPGVLRLGALVLPILLAACTTPYQEMGLRGGVRAVQITSDVAQVTARGSAATDPDAIERYIFRKAAETTLAAGYDRFEVLATTDRTKSIQGIAGYTAATTSGLPSLGLSLPFVRPGETVLIRMTRATSASESAGAFDARDVLAHLGNNRSRSQAR